MLLYIIRHGIPDYDNDCLTNEGRRQAEALARRLKASGIDKIYSSPRGRAIETARPTCDALGLEMHIMPFMDENEAGKSFFVKDQDGNGIWSFWRRQLLLGDDSCYKDITDFGRGFYNDENAQVGFANIKNSSDDFFKMLGYERTGVGNGYKVVNGNEQHIAAFCHQGFGLHGISYILNLPLHIFTASFDLSHSSMTVIDFHPEKGTDIAYPICRCLSDLSHIYASENTVLYNNSFKI